MGFHNYWTLSFNNHTMSEPTTPAHVPNVTFKVRVPHGNATPGTCSAIDAEWKDITTDELFKDKKVIVFALPGAFTPTCSSKHLPGYEAKYDEFKALGIDDIICLAVNDGYVMYEWGRAENVRKVRLIPDGSGNFTRSMGMLVKKDNLGYGERSWRYSMYVVNGEVRKVFAEPGMVDNSIPDPFEVSDAETMLAYLKAGNA